MQITLNREKGNLKKVRTAAEIFYADIFALKFHAYVVCVNFCLCLYKAKLHIEYRGFLYTYYMY